jgi:hypothetical protein
MVRVPFDIDDPAVSPVAGVDNEPAPNGAITADAGGLLGIPGFQHAGMGLDRFKVKPETADGNPGGRGTGNFDKVSSIEFHLNMPPWLRIINHNPDPFLRYFCHNTRGLQKSYRLQTSFQIKKGGFFFKSII